MNIYNLDSRIGMNELPDNSVDIVITSPPYADQRKKNYDGMNEDDYVDWFMPFAKEIKRVLKDTGSFFLNIKPHTRDGERSLYVFYLVIAIKKQLDMYFVDEFCWTKNAFPGSYHGRLKNGFEPIYHFTKIKPSLITFNPIACGTEIKPDSIKRSYRKQCGKPKNGSGMTGMNTTNIRNLKLARPSNVINVNNVSNQFTKKKDHPATYPIGLVDFFIKTFSNEGGVVLDPFMGSGTTGISAINNNRKFIGFEKKLEYFNLAKQRLDECICEKEEYFDF